MTTIRTFGTLLAAVALAMLPALAPAQDWPERSIRFIVPFPAGGSTDVIARMLAEPLRNRLGQPVVIDNKAGAGGTIGSDLAAKSAPDGYTMLIATSSTHAIAPAVSRALPYDPTRDFVPVMLIGSATVLLVTHPSVKAGNVAELIAIARADPRALTFASSGTGGVSHLIGEYFKSRAGIEMLHVPYKGDTPMIADLIGGQVSLAFGTAVAFLPQVRKGSLKALAVTNATPSPIAPELPTIAASGLPGFEALQWFGVLMPARTPAPIVDRVAREISEILKLPDVKDRLTGMGIEVSGRSSDAFARFMADETLKWKQVASDARITPN